MVKIKDNGNCHRGFWNPVEVFIRSIQGVWKKRDEVSGETYLADSKVVESDLEDVVDERQQKSQNDDN